MKRFYEDKMVKVWPRDGKPYETYLLTTNLCDLGRVYHVSGPEAFFVPQDGKVTELDGSEIKLTPYFDINGNKYEV